MKITCENCGTGIDTDKDKRCPNCGASYSNNKEYRELKDTSRKHTDYDFREREADIRTKELSNQMIEKTLNAQSKFKILPIIIGIIFIAIFIAAAYQIFNVNKEINGNETSKDKTILVNFNENAVTDNFDMKCDGITNYKKDIFEEKEEDKGIAYYNFHIVFNNKTDSWATLHDIALTYTDDKGNENISANRHSQNTEEMRTGLTSIATSKLSYSGNITFEIHSFPVKQRNFL